MNLFWTLRMELFYKYGFLQEFNPFEPFHLIQRIGPILHDSKNWTFFLHDSKNWTLFSVTQRIEPSFSWLKELNLFLRDSMNWIFFVFQRIVPLLLNVTQRIESLLKNWSFLTYMNSTFFWTFSYDSKNWTFFDMTRRIEPFWMWLKELKFSTENKSKNGFFRMWLKELKFFEFDS